MLPGVRERVGEQLVRHRSVLTSQMLHGIGHAGRVPVHDGGDHQIQPGRPELLRVLAAVDDTLCRVRGSAFTAPQVLATRHPLRW